MTPERIRIDWDDLRSTEHEAEPTPSVSERVVEDPAKAVVFDRLDSIAPDRSRAGHRPVHRRAWFYTTVAGLIGGFLSWGVSELLFDIDGGADTGVMMLVTVVLWSAILGAMITAAIASAESFIVGARRRMLRYAALGAGYGFVLGAAAGFVAQLVFGFVLALDAQADSVNEGGMLTLLIIARGMGWAVLGGVCGTICGIVARSGRKAFLGGIGGGIGGLVGGVMFDPLVFAFAEHDTAMLPRLIGLVLFASLTGLFISLSEQVARSTWLQIERGRLSGKQFIVYRNPTTIGSSSECDVYLFKDAAVAPVAATIERTPSGYTLTAERTIYVNQLPVRRHRLRNGDAIAIGETVLRFGERE